MSFTGNKDTDYKILYELDDKDLGSICSSNSYFKSLCGNDIFWRNRTIRNFSKYLGDIDSLNRYKNDNNIENWRLFYISIVDFLEKLKKGQLFVEIYKDYHFTILVKQHFLPLSYILSSLNRNRPSAKYNMIRQILKKVYDKEALDIIFDNHMTKGDWMHTFMFTSNKYIFDRFVSDMTVEEILKIITKSFTDRSALEIETVKLFLDAILQKGVTLEELKEIIFKLDKKDYNSLLEFFYNVYLPSIFQQEQKHDSYFSIKQIMKKLKDIDENNFSREDYDKIMEILNKY